MPREWEIESEIEHQTRKLDTDHPRQAGRDGEARADRTQHLTADQCRLLCEVVPISGPLAFTEVPELERAIFWFREITGAKVWLVRRSHRDWKVLAQTDASANLPSNLGTLRPTAARLRTTPTVDRLSLGAVTWTAVRLPARTVMLIEGDWTPSSPTLLQFANHLWSAERLRLGADHRRVRLAAHRLGLALARASGVQEVARAIVRYMTRAVGAEIGALAVADPDQRQLSIVATYGYPDSIIKNRRIATGAGVFGSVYETASPLRVTDVATYPGIKQRARYRTNSFLALPLTAGSQVLAVVSVTDRADNRAFTRDDLRTLNALAAPATLALARERAQAAATAHAQTAAIDPVSGLFNRRYFQGRIEEELERSWRQKTDVALLMIDIDDFKAINDSYGHTVGDVVICDTAEILRHSVRVFDVCTRYGGEEFAILMPGSDGENATLIAERIRQRVAEHRVSGPSSLRITVSIGVTVSEARTSVAQLVVRADRALYEAKRAGKNRVRTLIAGSGHAGLLGVGPH